MKIFTITMTPINPPDDDAAKNIVMGIAKRIDKHQFYFISSPGKMFPRAGNINYIYSPFQKVGRHSMSLLQRIFVFVFVLLNIRRIDLFQFFFTPQAYFSRTFRILVKKYHKKSIQIVSSIHTLLARNPAKPISGLFFADYVVTHSDYAKCALTDLGVKNTVRIYPGIEINRFNPATASRYPPDSQVVLGGASNIIYPGTYKALEESYSLEEFSRIVLDVTQRFKNVRFIMACRIRSKEDRILEKKFKDIIGRYSLSEFFSLLNTVQDLPSLFNSVTIGIMPAKLPMTGILEIPLVLIEMAAMEKPVIYGAVKPLDELESKGLGVKVSDPSSASYAAAISGFIEDKDYALAVGKKSREAAIKHFNMDYIAREYEKIYDTLKGAA